MKWRKSAALLTAAVVTLSDAGLANGEPTEQSNSRATASRMAQSQSRSSADVIADDHLARDWSLNAEEWTRYQQLMRGPLGVYSPALDPLTALGIEARSDSERRRYAELQVRAEARRVDKMLAYQRAYDDAWKRLYPTLQRIGTLPARSSDVTGNVTGNENSRLAVFVKDACPACDERVRQLQIAGRAFDIYMVGSRNDDAHIREWAKRVGIDPEKVRARVITLNHDGGHWLSIGGQGALPAVGHEVGGQWARE